MDELKSFFSGVQIKDKDQVFNILQEEGVSGNGTITFKRYFAIELTLTRFVNTRLHVSLIAFGLTS